MVRTRLATWPVGPQKSRGRARHARARVRSSFSVNTQLDRSTYRPSFESAPRSTSTRARVVGARLLATLLAAVALTPTAARADDLGTQGRIVRVSINATGSDDFASSHGSISVRHGNNKLEVYSWGGTMCPASKLGETEIAALQQAFHNRQRTLVVPRFKQGEVKDVRCLVGFELTGG